MQEMKKRVTKETRTYLDVNTMVVEEYYEEYYLHELDDEFLHS